MLFKFDQKTSVSFYLNIEVICIDSVSAAEDTGYDDVIYFGSSPETAKELFGKVGANGLINSKICTDSVPIILTVNSSLF